MSKFVDILIDAHNNDNRDWEGHWLNFVSAHTALAATVIAPVGCYACDSALSVGAMCDACQQEYNAWMLHVLADEYGD